MTDEQTPELHFASETTKTLNILSVSVTALYEKGFLHL